MSAKETALKRPSPKQHLENDGLFLGRKKLGQWSLRKYEILGYYCELFSGGMRYKWRKRVYIDALCGPGRGKIKRTDNIVETSPFVALRIPVPFSHYIFCDEDKKSIEALEQRIKSAFGNKRNVQYVIGDINVCYPEIIKHIPSNSLKLCFLDPYDIGVHFKTVEQLANVGNMDFLSLLALQMDARRNIGIYSDPNSTKVRDFLGTPDWRQRWIEYETKHGKKFLRFLAETYAERFVDIGYENLPIDKMVVFASKVDLYYLALFSRSERAYYYWKQVLKYATGQKSFDFMH
jgi:three-Cys-motif partner protein